MPKSFCPPLGKPAMKASLCVSIAAVIGSSGNRVRVSSSTAYNVLSGANARPSTSILGGLIGAIRVSAPVSRSIRYRLSAFAVGLSELML